MLGQSLQGCYLYLFKWSNLVLGIPKKGHLLALNQLSQFFPHVKKKKKIGHMLTILGFRRIAVTGLANTSA